MNPDALQVALRLPPGACRILATLMEANGAFLLRDKIAQDANLNTRSIKVYVAAIRSALGADAIDTRFTPWRATCHYRITPAGRQAVQRALEARVAA